MSETSTPRPSFVARQDPNAVDVCRGRPVALLLHAHGTMRLYEDPHSGGLFAEVNGLRSDAARRFLAILDGMPDIASEVLVADLPGLYPLDEEPVRRYHMRRDA